MHNEAQQKVIEAFNLAQRTRHEQEMEQFGQPQDHPSKEILEPIREIIALYATEQSFTPKEVVEGLGSWAASWALQAMKNIEEKSYDHPVNGRSLFCVSDSKLKFQWIDAGTKLA
jgi:hypothetical protein